LEDLIRASHCEVSRFAQTGENQGFPLTFEWSLTNLSIV